MLFWQSALLLSVLCTPVLGLPTTTSPPQPAPGPGEPFGLEHSFIAHDPSQPSAPEPITHTSLQGCWIGIHAIGANGHQVEGQHIGIVGNNIVMSTIPVDAQNPQILVDTYWKQTPTGCNGIAPRKEIIRDRIRLKLWDFEKQYYVVRFSSATEGNARYGNRASWTAGPPLGFGKKMSMRKNEKLQQLQAPLKSNQKSR